MSLCDRLENFVRFPQRDTLYLKAAFAQKIVFALLLRENDKKNNRKAKVKSRKSLEKSEISALSGPEVKSPIC